MAKRKMKSKGKWGKILLICLFAYFAVIMAVQQVTLDNQQSTLEKLEDKLNGIELKNKEMADQRDIMRTDEYIEYLLRVKLGWMRSDEKKYIVD
ncbi:MAG TPA: septum formation initiator family protein [Clostridia bacterium]|nr:septum formation initiator family protein [Clostridia bacterium]